MSQRRREALIVTAAELRPGDQITVASNRWVVWDPPVKIVMTPDVAVHLGARARDLDRTNGVHVRIPAHEYLTVLRATTNSPRT